MERRYLNLTQFSIIYDLHKTVVLKMIRDGQLQGMKMARYWRIQDPGWDWAQKLKNPDLMLDLVPVLRTRDVAVLLQKTERTIKWYRQMGYLKGKYMRSGYRYSIADIRAFQERPKKKPDRVRPPNMAAINWAKQRLSVPSPVKPHPFLQGPQD